MKIVLLFMLLNFTNSFYELQRWVESNNNQDAVSPVGAVGVAQFMPTTFDWMKDTNKIPINFSIYNASHQIIAQKTYMMYLYNLSWKGVNKRKATIASYNCGRGNVLKSINKNGIYFWEVGLPLETVNYLIKLKENKY